MISGKHRGFWIALNGLLLAALWLGSTGPAYLRGVPLEILEGLAAAKGLSGGPDTSLVFTVLGGMPGTDAIFNLAVFMVLAKMAAYIVLWWSLYKIWENPVSPTLTCGYLFFAAPFMWVTTDHPNQVLALVLQSLAVGAIAGAKVPLLCAAVLGLTPLNPPLGISLYFIMVYLALRRQNAYGLGLVGVTIVGTAALLLGLAADYTMVPSTAGLRAMSLLCLVALVVPEIRQSRVGLYLTMLLAAAATGAPEFGSLICLGDLALIGLKTSDQQADDEPQTLPGQWRLQRCAIVSLLAIITLTSGVADGERWLNRKVLVPSQKAHVSLGTLFHPFSIQVFAREVQAGQWTRSSPIPGFGADEFRILQSLKGPFRLLSDSANAARDRTLGLYAALLANRPLHGWATPEALSASSLACKATGANVLTGDDTVVFFGGDSPRVLAPVKLPADHSKLANLSLASLWSLPFRRQTLSTKKGAAYRLQTENTDEVLYFPDTPAVLVLSAAPLEYHISSEKDPSQKRDLQIGEYKLSLKLSKLEQPLPSRTLIPIKVRLTNEGVSPLSTHETTSLGFHLVTEPAEPDLRQPFSKSFILYPKESLETELFLPTPPAEGNFRLEAAIYTSDGRSHKAEMKNPEVYTTWRRLPPVGTWVEEPPTP